MEETSVIKIDEAAASVAQIEELSRHIAQLVMANSRNNAVVQQLGAQIVQLRKELDDLRNKDAI